jgi:hypothetical protein
MPLRIVSPAATFSLEMYTAPVDAPVDDEADGEDVPAVPGSATATATPACTGRRRASPAPRAARGRPPLVRAALGDRRAEFSHQILRADLPGWEPRGRGRDPAVPLGSQNARPR